MTFAHLTIATRDVEATAAFYENTLGWRRIHAPQNSPVELAWLEMGPGQHLHILRRDDWPDPMPEIDTEFGRHVAVFHDGRKFDQLKQRLSERGGEVVPAIRPTPFERFFFRDPNGYMFEVIDEHAYVQE